VSQTHTQGAEVQTAPAAPVAQAADIASLPNAQIIDVRRSVRFADATTMLPRAIWRDPEHLADWAGELTAGQEVIVYCVFGHEVSQGAALALQSRGVNARYLEGGIEGWIAAGHQTVPKQQ
jgi:superoxide dismutase, Fe-Mn family